ncbi:hypothetical protein [Citrifermentans bremense]|uniref:hypothetical protein n=1 Tax=Citrifermentans bremense TaxID=60035 RepID=UPI000412837A|nr:hypothetical protein [Citrifermentans bremense]
MRSMIKRKILDSEEIYRINSVFPKYKAGVVYTYYFLLAVACIVAIVSALKYMPKELALFIITILIMSFVVLCFTFNRLFSRGNPLVFTKTGIYLEPFIYESWGDICGFSFKRYDGIFRTTLTTKGCGITLLIYNIGPNQRTINLRGQSFTTTNGIFFDDSQIESIECLFNAHGIQRRILSDEL